MPKVHIWCPRASSSAVALRDALIDNGTLCYKSKANQADNVRIPRMLRRVEPNDLWINWGPPSDFTPNCKQLNATKTYTNKADQLIKLAEAGVLVPEVYTGPGEGRIGRSANHQGGTDLLRGGGRDYYTQKLNITREFRVHVFNGLSIRAGMKVPRTENPHPWIRSYDGGWKLDYGHNSNAHVTNAIRTIAKQAVAALKLDFGAVDVGLVGNRPVVLEVNLAPGLDEGPSVDAYVRHILQCVPTR